MWLWTAVTWAFPTKRLAVTSENTTPISALSRMGQPAAAATEGPSGTWRSSATNSASYCLRVKATRSRWAMGATTGCSASANQRWARPTAATAPSNLAHKGFMLVAKVLVATICSSRAALGTTNFSLLERISKDLGSATRCARSSCDEGVGASTCPLPVLVVMEVEDEPHRACCDRLRNRRNRIGEIGELLSLLLRRRRRGRRTGRGRPLRSGIRCGALASPTYVVFRVVDGSAILAHPPIATWCCVCSKSDAPGHKTAGMENLSRWQTQEERCSARTRTSALALCSLALLETTCCQMPLDQ